MTMVMTMRRERWEKKAYKETGDAEERSFAFQLTPHKEIKMVTVVQQLEMELPELAPLVMLVEESLAVSCRTF